MQHEQVLRRPLVTEATKTIEAQNAYAFEVDPKADKPAIKAAVEAIYNVRVLRVTTKIVRAKCVATATVTSVRV